VCCFGGVHTSFLWRTSGSQHPPSKWTPIATIVQLQTSGVKGCYSRSSYEIDSRACEEAMPIPQPLTGFPNMVDYLYLHLSLSWNNGFFWLTVAGLVSCGSIGEGVERNLEINVIFSLVGFCSILRRRKILWNVGSGRILWYRFFHLTAYWHSAILYQINCHRSFLWSFNFVILSPRSNLVLSGNYLDPVQH